MESNLHYPKFTDLNVNRILNIFIKTCRIMFEYIYGCCDLAKLTHKINYLYARGGC